MNDGNQKIPALWLFQYTMAVVANSPDHQQHLHYQQPTKYYKVLISAFKTQSHTT